MRISIKHLARASLCAALGSACALALADAPLPAVQHEADIAYLSGGIGQGEARAIEAAEGDWPLTLEFAQHERHHGLFVADVGVVVRDAQGHRVLRTNSEGPFLLAKLPPGRYAIDATLDGRTLHERVAVSRGDSRKAIFLWPAGTDQS